jgi:tRNA modification GTPase
MNMLKNDTICAIGTRIGESAIGIVRLSGNNAIKISEKIFISNNGRLVREMLSYTMAYGYIIDEKKDVVDQVILSVMKSPKSYTREDVIEINCHGGIIATNKVMSLCLSNGARLSDPGEFTKRAFLNGRIDLTQAEAVIDIIRAKTEQSLKIAASNIKGNIKNKLEIQRKELLEILIDLEASIDFIEEDLEITPYEDLEKRVHIIYKEIKDLVNDEKKGELVKNGIKAAIVGKPNVGKSSLLNAISKKEKAIVTHIPGTTRDAIEEIIYLKGIPVIFIDTAGIRKAKNIIEKIGVKNSMSFIEEAEILLIVIDASSQLDSFDEEILKKVNLNKAIICFNKTDIANVIKKDEFLEKFRVNLIVEISAKKGIGIKELESKIMKKISQENDFNIKNKIIINIRHKRILIEVLNCLKNSIKAMKKKMSEEFPSSDLKQAYNLLGEIIGTNASDEIINGIFNKFCIGK